MCFERWSIEREEQVLISSEKKKISPLYFLALFAFVFWATSGYGSIGNYLAAAFCLVLIFLDCLMFKQKYSIATPTDKSIFFFLLFFSYHFITSVFNMDSMTYWIGNVIVYTFVSYYPLFIQKNVSGSDNWYLRRVMLKAVAIIWGFMVAFSIFYYIKNPEIARDAIVYQDQYDNLFIGGGYDLAYGSCIIAVFLFGLLRNGWFNDRKEKRNVIIIVVILSVHVLLTKSTLTSIWLALGLIMDYVFGKRVAHERQKRRKKIIAFTIVLCATLFFLIFHKSIGAFLMSTFNYGSESLYSRRLYELGTVISGDTMTRHTLERFSKPVMSWKKFVESPIIGIGYKYGYTYNAMKLAGLGTHSEIMDTLAKYGIIGFSLWVGMIVNFIKSVQNRLGANAPGSWYIILLLMMFFNPFVSMPSMIALTFIIPLVSMIVIDKKEVEL